MSGAVAMAHCHPAGGAALGGTLGAAASGETVLVTRVETGWFDLQSVQT